MEGLRGVVVVLVVVCGLTSTISLTAGDQPLAVSPGSGVGTLVSSSCPTFSWGAVSGATSYELVTYQVPDGLSPGASPADLTELWRVALPGSARSWTPSASRCFTHGGSYAWAVRAVVGGTPGAWSDANLFSIEKAPSAEEVRTMMAEMGSYLEQESLAEASSGSTVANSVAHPRPASRSTAQFEALHRGSTAGARGLKPRGSNLMKARGMRGALRSRSQAATTPSLGTPSLSVDGNVSLGASSNVFKDGKVLLWDDTTGNLALGDFALSSVSGTATYNTAVGDHALANTTGQYGFPYGGSGNTAIGYHALAANTTGFSNSATGFQALSANTTGRGNTASGYEALSANTTGEDNTANGYKALYLNDTGFGNVASGSFALQANTSGQRNTASGHAALTGNTGGQGNTASGFFALSNNGGGNGNSATGAFALQNNTGGSGNVAVGYEAGYKATAPDDSIFIGNTGATGDTTTIKIGTQGTQTSTYIAGIRDETVASGDGLFVLVDSNGKLGTSSSSRRYKQDIADMGDVTDRLYALRPVIFRYKEWVKQALKEGKDPSKLPHSYGLIAEEVEKVFPDLVVYDKRGRPDAVKYRLLIPMLLNELQKEHWAMIEQEYLVAKQTRSLDREAASNAAQQSTLEREAREIAAQRSELVGLERQLRDLRSILSDNGIRSRRVATQPTAATRASSGFKR